MGSTSLAQSLRVPLSLKFDLGGGPFQLFWGLFRPPIPHQSDKASSSARAAALWKMKGRLLIVAIAAFRVVEALDVAALVSNMALAEKESLLSRIGWGTGGYDLGAGWCVANTPSILLDSTFPPRSSCRTRGRAIFVFRRAFCCLGTREKEKEQRTKRGIAKPPLSSAKWHVLFASTVTTTTQLD